MPEWFVTLGYITLTVIMVEFLGWVAVGMVTVAAVIIREWLKERKDK